jgi:O-antigen/teichoic acid export membrane protein
MNDDSGYGDRADSFTGSGQAAIMKAGTPAEAQSAHHAVFSRMRRNIGWLLSSRGFTAVASFAYLSLAARTLGLSGFGAFTLILAYAQAIANLAQFRSWQAVIRYGSVHQTAGQSDRMARLAGFTASLDWASALIGAVVAVLGVYVAGPLLSWTEGEQYRAAIFGGVLLLSTGATASGLLRLSNRFDLLAYVDMVSPAIRLCGALIIWSLGGGLDLLLLTWAIAALAQCLSGWFAAVFPGRSRMVINRDSLRAALRENRGIMRFMLQTNGAASIGIVGQQLGTLAVGAIGGPAAAGAFRIAGKVADGIGKPVEMITRTLFPELARLVAEGDVRTLRRVVRRVTEIAGALAAAMLIGVGFAGDSLLRLFVGRGFSSAHSYLWLLALAAAINLIGFALDPLLTAFGRAGRSLRIRTVGAAAYLAALVLLLPTVGTKGAAVAAIVSALVVRGQLVLAVLPLLRKRS